MSKTQQPHIRITVKIQLNYRHMPPESDPPTNPKTRHDKPGQRFCHCSSTNHELSSSQQHQCCDRRYQRHQTDTHNVRTEYAIMHGSHGWSHRPTSAVFQGLHVSTHWQPCAPRSVSKCVRARHREEVSRGSPPGMQLQVCGPIPLLCDRKDDTLASLTRLPLKTTTGGRSEPRHAGE